MKIRKPTPFDEYVVAVNKLKRYYSEDDISSMKRVIELAKKDLFHKEQDVRQWLEGLGVLEDIEV